MDSEFPDRRAIIFCMVKKFTKKIEDFNCDNCGTTVKGTGYTNHCPACLYSKHVDVNPGDREAICGGFMKPVELSSEKGKFVLTFECQKCQVKKRNKMAADDNFDEALKVKAPTRD